MATVTIPLGATIHIVWVDGKVGHFVFRGNDAKGLIFETPDGQREFSVTDRPYLSITIEPTR